MQRSLTFSIVLLGALVVTLGLIAYQFATPPAPPSPEMPVRQAQVLPSSEFLDPNAATDYYRARIMKQPEAVDNYVELAQVYLQLATTTAHETRYVPLAEELVEEALGRDPEHYHARLLQATLLNKQHRFEEARDLARALIAEYPRHAYPWGLLVDALVELGAYPDAVAASDSMLHMKPSLPSYARAAYLRELHGDGPGAIAAMELAVEAGAPGRADRAWAAYQLGQLYLGAGEPAKAEAIFEGILDERPRYAFAVGGLAQVHLAAGEAELAADLFREAYDLAPSPAFLEGLHEAYAMQGDTALAARVAEQLLKALDDAEAIGERVDMERADMLADQDRDLARALRLAEREYQRRPGHLHAAETYAWVLHKNGRSEAALQPIEQAMRLGTGDAMVAYRAGLIYQGAGRPDRARRYLEAALAQGLHVESGTAAGEARAVLEAMP